jgi:hypothetical protein
MEVDIEMVIDEEDDEVQNENELEIPEGMTLMMNLCLQMVLTMKWLIVMMRLMIRLTPTHMKIIFNRCNAIFFISHLFLNTSFFICAYLVTLNCMLLDKDGRRWDEEEEHP